jgi:hypothetical protein
MTRGLDVETFRTFPYETYGPFPIASLDDLSSRALSSNFWDDLDEKYPGVSSAIGVYIFAIRSQRTSPFRPWYVGKTDRGFQRRFHNQGSLFRKLMDKNGEAFVFLIARRNQTSTEFMGSRKGLGSNNVLETMLIERCLEVNPKLLNANKVNYVRGLVVPGFKGKTVGKPKSSARQLRTMIKLSVSKEQ